MKERLLKILKAKEAEKRSLVEKAKISEDVGELRGINTNLESLNEEIEEFRSMIDAIPKSPEDEVLEARSADQQMVGAQKIVGTYNMGDSKVPEARSEDPHGTLEYRSAFKDFVVNGIDSETIRAATAVGDIGPVIPTTVLNKIVERMEEYGRIFKRVTKTSLKGGVTIPLATVKPTATWVTGNAMSGEQKKGISGTIVFAYHKLQCRVAIDLIADTVSLPMFEKLLIDNINEAMVNAIEGAIINGTGSGQPLGITVDAKIPAAQIIELAEADISKYKTWTTILGKMPRKYRKGMVIIMNDSDWTQHIEGMVDANERPVARITYGVNGEETETLNGKEVLAVEDHVSAIADAEVGDVIAILVNLKDYILNSNMQLTLKKYFDENTDEYKYKSTLIADGKLGDHNGVVLIKKKASA